MQNNITTPGNRSMLNLNNYHENTQQFYGLHATNDTTTNSTPYAATFNEEEFANFNRAN